MIHSEPLKKLLEKRESALEMTAEEFRSAGHWLVDQMSEFLKELPENVVTRNEKPSQIQNLLGDNTLPEEGLPAVKILEQSSKLLIEHSLFNGHPRFWGYITSSATPIGALGDMLASTINANVGAYSLSPMATEIEKQTIRWIAELIGYSSTCGGLFVSGGNMANFTGFLATRKAKAGWDIRNKGLKDHSQLILYCGAGTHTWIQKAADLFGLGIDAIRWVALNEQQQIDTEILEQLIAEDLHLGYLPFLVVGTAGSVSSGVVDDLSALAKICKKHKLWFHIDGAYGAPAAALDEYGEVFEGIKEADSIALDPHKWLYSPLEAGCILVRDSNHLLDAFSFHPDYYNFSGTQDDPPTNYFDYGLQNSRGFRAFKVWLSLKQAGKNGYITSIRQDISLAKFLFELVNKEEQLQAFSHHLSITTFRYRPANLPSDEAEREELLNQFNEVLLNRLQSGGEVYLSNALIQGKYCLRVCVVNFRTSYQDMKTLVNIILREGKLLENERLHLSI